MRSNFNRLSKPEVDLIVKKTNFTEEEEVIFHMLCRGKSLDQICLETFLPKSTLCRRIHSIKEKVGDNKMSVKVPIWEKVALTLEEAAEYSNIGINKIRDISNDPRCTFVIFVGKKRLIKRKEFEKYISENVEL